MVDLGKREMGGKGLYASSLKAFRMRSISASWRKGVRCFV